MEIAEKKLLSLAIASKVENNNTKKKDVWKLIEIKIQREQINSLHIQDYTL